MSPEDLQQSATAAEETVCVIVPCLDEADNLDETVAEILAAAPSLPVRLRLALVDDGSSDGTADVMTRLCAEHPECSMHVNETNQGIGRSVLEAVARNSGADWATIVPGDNEFVFDSLRNHLAVRAEADVVLGYVQNSVVRTTGRRFASACFRAVTNSLYGFTFHYLNGFILFRVPPVLGIDVISTGHAFFPELLAKAQLRTPGLRIREVPYISRGRPSGASKAIRPLSVLRAAWETWRGYRSVSQYRHRVTRRSLRSAE
ncbi:MAG: glycosyltransferase family 2 protein [Thermoanaerobaculia bacterium]